MRNIAAKKRARQEDVDSDCLFVNAKREIPKSHSTEDIGFVGRFELLQVRFTRRVPIKINARVVIDRGVRNWRAGMLPELRTALMAAYSHIPKILKEGQEAGKIVAGDPDRLALTIGAALHGLVAIVNRRENQRRSTQGHRTRNCPACA